jgi:ferredoxin-fold anticodon binding domain-containing protein
MNPSTYIPIIVLWIIIFYVIFRNRRAVVARQIIKKRKLEGNAEMKELAKRFIDKECLISSFDSNHQFEGVVKEVSDSAILVEKNGTVEAINLDFVIRIREYPKNKKGKKKSVVLD